MTKTCFLLLFLLSTCINPQEAKDKALVIKGMASTISKKFSNAPQLRIEDYNKMKSTTILVDIRSDIERAVSFIPGSISQEDFEKNKNAYRDKTIVSYCTIGQRSSAYTENLIKEGFKAFNLEESLLGWTQRQLPLTTSSGEATKKVHVYGEAWNLVPDNYQGIWK